ncbi:MAG: 4Fe-4S dicluster domain-containing protein [Candidatus Bathyarchaeota archaeon]
MKLKMEDVRTLVERVKGTGNFIHHNKDRCTRCGRCVNVCPMGLWSLKDREVSILEDYTEKCVECGCCWIVCPSNAIEFNYPKGGTGVCWKYG